MPTSPPGNESILLAAVFVEGGLAVVAWAIGWLVGVPPGEQIAWNTRGLLVGVLGAAPLVPALLWMVHSRWRPLRRIRALVTRTLVAPLASRSYLDLALIAGLAGFGEEALFRGVLQPLAAGYTGASVAVVAVAILFGLAHALTTAYFVFAAILGAYLGWLAVWSGNLLAPIVTHAVYDFLAFAYLAHRYHRREQRRGRRS